MGVLKMRGDSVGLGDVVLAITTAVLVFVVNAVDDRFFYHSDVWLFLFFYLGVKIIAPKHATEDGKVVVRVISMDMLVRGVVINISNPKVLVFFLSFIPQFVPDDAVQPAFYAFGLGFLLCVIGTTMNFSFGLAGTAITPLNRILFLQRSLMQYLLSSVFVTIAMSFLIGVIAGLA